MVNNELNTFISKLEKAKNEGDFDAVSSMAAEYGRISKKIESILSPAKLDKNIRFSAQNIQYMIDLLPYLQTFFAEYPRGTSFSVLDIGAGTGQGTELLAKLYNSDFLGYTLSVSTLDIRTTWHPYIRAFCRNIKNDFYQDIFDIFDQKWDLVICSHVLEHVPDPVVFSRKLTEIAKEAVFCCAPYKEPMNKLSKAHLHSLDDNFIDRVSPLQVWKLHSVAWGAFMNPPYEMFIMRLAPRSD